jgi:hypothetical protein
MEFLRSTKSCLKGIKQCLNPNSNDTTISYEQTPSFAPVKTKSAQSCHHTDIYHSKDRFQSNEIQEMNLSEFPLLVVTPEKPRATGLTSTFINFESSAVLSNDLTQISPEPSQCQHFEIIDEEELDVSECDGVAFSNECYNSPAISVTNAFANTLYDSPEIKQARRQINFDDLTYVSVDLGLSSTDFHPVNKVNPSFFSPSIHEIFV